jgi:hypothetical protein
MRKPSFALKGGSSFADMGPAQAPPPGLMKTNGTNIKSSIARKNQGLTKRTAKMAGSTMMDTRIITTIHFISFLLIYRWCVDIEGAT